MIGWAALALVLGIWGTIEALPQTSWLQRVYLTIQLFWANQNIPDVDPWQLAWARVIAPLFTLVAAATAVLAVLADRMERSRARRMHGHTVVCGLGEKGYQIVRALRAGHDPVVVIERDAENDYLPLVRQLGARAFAADASLRESLEQAGVPHARRLVAICASDELNVEIAYVARDVRQRSSSGAPRRRHAKAALRCLTHVGDAGLWRLLQESSLSQGDTSQCMVEYFNFADRAAEDVVRRWLLDSEGGLLTSVRQTIVIGDGPVADRICWHILAISDPPSLYPDPRGDPSVDVDMLLREPETLCECVEVGEHSTVLVSMDTDPRTLHMALALEREYRHFGVTVVACTTGDAGFARAVGGCEPGGGGLRIHDLMDCLRSPEIVLRDMLDDLGRGIHEKWLAGELNAGAVPGGDARMCHWGDLPDEWRLESLQQAADIQRKLMSLGVSIVEASKADGAFSFKDTEAADLARMEHERWKASKEARGYRFGPQRNEASKLHEALLPWEELPEDVQRKNVREITDIPALLATVDLGCRRREV